MAFVCTFLFLLAGGRKVESPASSNETWRVHHRGRALPTGVLAIWATEIVPMADALPLAV